MARIVDHWPIAWPYSSNMSARLVRQCVGFGLQNRSAVCIRHCVKRKTTDVNVLGGAVLKSALSAATSSVLTILFTTHRSRTRRLAFSAESSGFHGSSPDSSKPALDARKVFGSGVVAAGKKEGGDPEGPPLPNLLIALAISTGAGEEIRTLDPNLDNVVTQLVLVETSLAREVGA